jgi:hypothetical protein
MAGTKKDDLVRNARMRKLCSWQTQGWHFLRVLGITDVQEAGGLLLVGMV